MIQRWLYSTNAKDISIIYFILALFSGIVGSTISIIIRIELSSPGSQYLHGNNQLFNVLVVGHAVLIIFFLAIPALIGGFGNYILPLIIGATDISFPRINSIGFWLLPIALVFSDSSMSNIQTVSIIAAFPIGIIMLLIIWSFFEDANIYIKELQNAKSKK